MSVESPQVAATRPCSGPSPSRTETVYDPDDFPQKGIQPRDIVRLFQCRTCSLPLREPISLPCGKSICKSCVPETHLRSNITYPAAPDRLQGFQCPFPECGKEHAVDDIAVDVILKKAARYIRTEVELARERAESSDHTTTIMKQNAWAAAGISSLMEEESPVTYPGGKLVATFTLAEEGSLKYEADVAYVDIPTKSNRKPRMFDDMDVLKKAQEQIRPEMDCQICYALFLDPLTTACGHTFCRSCLHRILDHSSYCPVCRRRLSINPQLSQTSCPSNDYTTKIITTFWLDEVIVRREMLRIEQANRLDDCDIPLFVCTLAFPRMPTFLHVFEPRYRLMIRRAMEGNGTFGMVVPKHWRDIEPDGPPFEEFGTLLKIVTVQYFSDGRSMIETVGLSRFRVASHGFLDGYIVGKVDRIDDVSLQEEEAIEAAEASEAVSVTDDEPYDADNKESNPSGNQQQSSITLDDINTMSTSRLMNLAVDFVQRMGDRSVPWLAERMISIYGECPNDPAIFPWWFASMLPVKDIEKYRLLSTSSVRDRLKICYRWILEWETSRWLNVIDRHSALPTPAESSDGD